ncbi:hypothetical protein CLOP_g17515 [Closterium sp. NIES-67]|nr:hypothetical protein CLOP_g17515 [Closterium sp. NIES-67]
MHGQRGEASFVSPFSPGRVVCGAPRVCGFSLRRSCPPPCPHPLLPFSCLHQRSHSRLCPPSSQTHPFPLPPTITASAASASAVAIPPASPIAAAAAAAAPSQGLVAAAVAVTAAAAAAASASAAAGAAAMAASAGDAASAAAFTTEPGRSGPDTWHENRSESRASEQIQAETPGAAAADEERRRGGAEEGARRDNVEEGGAGGGGMMGGAGRGDGGGDERREDERDGNQSNNRQQQQQQEEEGSSGRLSYGIGPPGGGDGAAAERPSREPLAGVGLPAGGGGGAAAAEAAANGPSRESQAGVGLPAAAAAAAGAESPSRYPQAGVGLHAQIEALDRVFDLVALKTKVEMPLCCHCASHVCREIDAQVTEAEEEIAAYEAALQSILASTPSSSSTPYYSLPVTHVDTPFPPTAMAPMAPMGDNNFEQHMAEVEVEERRLQQEQQQLLQQREQLRAQLGEVEAEQAELDAAEESYWHEFNEFQYHVSVHQETRDALLASIEVAAAQSEALRRSFVLNDAFHIWHEGEFGTINNLRLGRLPSVPVEWEELNAAWGQACHLLFTLARIANCPVAHRIIPMGSFPRISDGHNQFELFGPVNLFWSTRYDRAMLLFLQCLKEFADFANAHDRANHLPPEKSFQLPYKIEGDKIQGLTVKQSFNRDERWTKALKYLLCDLKWALVWTMNNFHPPLPTPPPAIINLASQIEPLSLAFAGTRAM